MAPLPDSMNRDAHAAILPDEVGTLVVQPVQRLSTAMSVGTVVQTAAAKFRIPLVTKDATAAWTPEGDEITVSDAGTDELVIEPSKLASLTVISRELANDSDPEAVALVGEGVARDIAGKIDRAFFGNTVAYGPAGLESLHSSVQHVDTAVTALTSLDPFAEAISRAEDQGANITAFVANARTVLKLTKLRQATGSNVPLLQPDPTAPSRRQILGVTLHSVPNDVLPDDTVWCIDQSRVTIVRREDVGLAVDESRYFERDSIGIRCTMRVGWGFPHPAALVRIGEPDGS